MRLLACYMEATMFDSPLSGKLCWEYFRASTTKQPGSINDQRIVLDKLIADQGGIKIGESSDIKTGKVMKRRAGIKEIISRVTEKGIKKIDIIVVHEISRLGRSPSQLSWLSELLEFYDVKIYTPGIGLVNEIIINALGLVAKLLLDAINKNTRRAHDARTLEGLHVGPVPFGYKAVERDGKKGYLEKTADAETIKRLFAYWNQGLKLIDILSIFVSEGKRGPRGGRLTIATLRRWLNNPKYKGLNVWGRTKVVVNPTTEREIRVPQPMETWTVHPGLHEPIVSEEEFDAALRRSEECKAQLGNFTRKGDRGRRAFLTGLFRCPQCKAVLNVMGGDKMGRKYLGCDNHFGGKSYFADSGEPALCTNKRMVRRDLLAKTLVDGLEPVLRHPAAIAHWLAVFNKDRNLNFEEEGHDLEPNRKRLAVIIENLSNFERAVAAGVNPDAFKDKINELYAERIRLDKAITDDQRPPVQLQLDMARVEDCLEAISRLRERLSSEPLDQVDQQTSAIFSSLIHHGFVYPDPNGRGFEIELFGQLAYLTSEGQTEVARFRSENFKEIDTYRPVKDDFLKECITVQVPAVPLFRTGSAVSRIIPAIRRVLIQSGEPRRAPELISILTANGLLLSGDAPARALVRLMNRHCDKFVYFRGKGYWPADTANIKYGWDPAQPETRSNLVTQCPAKKYIGEVTTIESALRDAKRPLTRLALLNALEQNGLSIKTRDKLGKITEIVLTHPETFISFGRKGYWLKNESCSLIGYNPSAKCGA